MGSDPFFGWRRGRTWEEWGWPYAPAFAFVVGPLFAFLLRMLLGPQAGWREIRAWGVVVAVAAIVAELAFSVTMTPSGLWSTWRGNGCHGAKLGLAQLCVGFVYLDRGGVLARFALPFLAGGALVMVAVLVEQCLKRSGRQARARSVAK